MSRGEEIRDSNDTGLNKTVTGLNKTAVKNSKTMITIVETEFLLLPSFSFSYFVCVVQISGQLFLCQSLTEISHLHQSPIRDQNVKK